MYESEETLELQNINFGIISRKMSFKAMVLADIIQTESIDGEETGAELKLKVLEHLHVR